VELGQLQQRRSKAREDVFEGFYMEERRFKVACITKLSRKCECDAIFLPTHGAHHLS
jgi:hypothetical protein